MAASASVAMAFLNICNPLLVQLCYPSYSVIDTEPF